MQQSMGRFWDRRARENAFFFVDDRLDYRHPDTERFWVDGERDLAALLGLLGVSIGAEDRILEIGCGVGRLTRALARAGCTVVALDVSEVMLELAREHNPDLSNVEWVLGDGFGLSAVGAARFDVCISHVVFQHIPDPEITLGYVREIGRVLRPGGWTAFQVSNDRRLHTPATGAKALKALARRRLGQAPQGQDDPRWLGSSVDVAALRAAAAESSMAVERVVGEGTQFCCVLARRESERPI